MSGCAAKLSCDAIILCVQLAIVWCLDCKCAGRILFALFVCIEFWGMQGMDRFVLAIVVVCCGRSIGMALVHHPLLCLACIL